MVKPDGEASLTSACNGNDRTLVEIEMATIQPRFRIGDRKFQGNFIGDTGACLSDWSGEYKLP
jgi:hypothetical protein